MSFCCGASMIGTVGTLKHHQSYIHQVPILYCPICQTIHVHPRVKEEYEILADYAHTDHAPEVFFNDYVDLKNTTELFADCIDIDGLSKMQVVRTQIDHALDLLSVAKHLQDREWESQLHFRLKVLSEHLKKHKKRETKQNG